MRTHSTKRTFPKAEIPEEPKPKKKKKSKKKPKEKPITVLIFSKSVIEFNEKVNALNKEGYFIQLFNVSQDVHTFYYHAIMTLRWPTARGDNK